MEIERFMDIEIDDFIGCVGFALHCGIVTGEGMLNHNTAIWVIRDCHGDRSMIPKSQAELICPSYGDMEAFDARTRRAYNVNRLQALKQNNTAATHSAS